MTLEAGRRLGLFEVMAPLGAGGMGEVYRARDERLGREVAIKVLPEAFAANADRLARFEREARLLAALNHPGIAAIHGLEQSNGVRFLVLELVEGKTLAERLDRGALPQREALEITRQIAEALEAAHEKGIVHRDLKPSNIKLTPAGKVKLLDFGLAKALGPDAPDAASRSPTETEAPTREGAVLGTAPYMSPEQARGEAVDKRTDVWAFGCVLFEMLTGRRAFAGATTSDTIVSVLTAEPDWRALPSGTRAAVQTLLRRCLNRDLVHRLHDVGDARIEIEEALAAPAQGPASPRRASLVPWLLAAAALVAAGAITLRRAPEAPTTPSYTQLTFRRGTIPAARFAPDGQTVVYSAAWEGGPNQIYSMRIGSVESRPLGIQGNLLSISRTGELAVKLEQHSPSLNFPTFATLAEVSLSGGAPRELLGDVKLADWDPEGRDLAIVRLVKGRERLEYPIGRVLYEPPGEVLSMRFLPSGSLALLEDVAGREPAFSLLDPKGQRRLLSEGWNWIGHIGGWCERTHELWFAASRAEEDVALHAVDLSGRRRLVGRVLGDLSLYDVDAQGRVLMGGGEFRSAVMALPPGETRERDVSALNFTGVGDLSADGHTLLLLELSGEAGRAGVYLKRTDGSPAVRLGAGEPASLSRDGKWALALPSKGAVDHLLLLPTGAGEARELRHPALVNFYDAHWLPDGRRIVVTAGKEETRTRLYIWEFDDRPPVPISAEEAWGSVVVSQDGRWLAAKGRTLAGLVLLPVNGGEPKPVLGREDGDGPRSFSADGRWLFVQRDALLPARVDRIDLQTGVRRLWKEIMPSDPTGVQAIAFVMPTPDGRAYAYQYSSRLSNLYFAEGLR